jgi:predicted dehydrogenase
MNDAFRFTRRDAIVGAAGAAKAFAANDRIGIGMIGVGIRGTQLLNNFKVIPGAEIAAVCDVYDGHFTAAREFTRANLPVTRDYREVLSRRDVDAVVIATPDHLHLRMALDALAAGKHIYIEKPMTWSIEQGMELRRAAERSNRVIQVGSGAGSSAAAKKAAELIASGAIGQLTMIRLSNNRNSPEGAWVYPIPPDASEKTIDWKRFLGPAPERPYDPKVFFRWRCWWEYSGGVATDLFVHLLTMIHGVTGAKAPKSVVSQGGLYRWKDGRTVPDVMNSIFEYNEGFVADMYVNLNNGRDPHPPTFMGTEGTIIFERETSRAVKVVLIPEPLPPPVQSYGSIGWPEQMRKQYLATGGRRVEAKKAEEFVVDTGTNHQETFLAAVRQGKNLAEGPFEGFAASGAAHLANLAWKNGRRMGWDVHSGTVES